MLGPEIEGEIAQGGFGHNGFASATGSTPAADCGFQFAKQITPSGALRSPDHCLVESVPQSKRDDDIGRLGLVQFQTRPAVVAPAGQIHDHAGLLGLDRLHDVEPVAVEKESVLAEQVVELRNHWMVVGKWPGLRIGPKFARAVQS